MESERRAVSAAHVSRVVRPGRHLASCSPRPSYVAKLPSGKVMRPAGLPTGPGCSPIASGRVLGKRFLPRNAGCWLPIAFGPAFIFCFIGRACLFLCNFPLGFKAPKVTTSPGARQTLDGIFCSAVGLM